MSITNFIPTVWSESLYNELDRRYIGVANCNREFEGDIKNQGSVVKICGVGSINVGDYTKNTDMSAPQTLDDNARDLVIDQAKFFNFQIDDIDRAQSNPKLMDAAMKNAAQALAETADRYIYSLHMGHPYCRTYESTDETSILDHIIDGREMLYRQNVYDDSEIVLEVSPAVASLIYRAKLDLSTSNAEALETGCIGSIAGCKVFVSNSIETERVTEDQTLHYCYLRTKRAIAFAEQLSEIDAYRPEHRFADAVKGLHLYGAKIVYPKELVVLTMNLSSM